MSGQVVLAPRFRGSEILDRAVSARVYRWYMPLGDNILKKALRGILIFFYCVVIVSKENIGLVICGQPVMIGLAGLLLKRIRGTAYHVWVYGGEIVKFRENRIIFSLLRKVVTNAEKVVANSAFTKEEYEKFGVPPEKIITILPTVDKEKFRPGLSAGDIIERYGLEGKRVILTVSRLSRRKGHDSVIKALEKLKERFPELVYLVVGKGPHEKALVNEARGWGLEKRVVFAGYVSDEDLPRYYNLCDVYVMPNREVRGIDTLEGFGISFIEAGACEKPVIGGRSGGSSDAVLDGETGYLIDPLDIDSLSEKIALLLENHDISAAMGRKARQRISEKFQPQDRARELIAILEGRRNA